MQVAWTCDYADVPGYGKVGEKEYSIFFLILFAFTLTFVFHLMNENPFDPI